MNLSAKFLAIVLLATAGAAASAEEARVDAATQAQALLPLTEVVLYTSGVGYFQRDGVVDGHRRVELRFKVEQVNDLLKSMVAQDFDGGQVSAVSYDSRDPIAKTLKTFAVDLTANLSLGQLLERLRGERVELTTPSAVRGVILGIEKKQERVGDKEVMEVEHLNLMTADGLRSVPFTQVQRIQFASERLNAELRQALDTLAAGRDTQKKTVRLDFDGTGRRRVRVGYIAETPVWKVSYRLALSDTKRPFLQGWAIVENTTDDEWEHVKLSLVSGRPISFVMDLYEPLYVKRPVVALDLYESLRPQVYEQALGETAVAMAAPPPAPRAAPATAVRAAPGAALAPQTAPAEVSLERGVRSVARVEAAGELFQYTITAPVSLGRHQSALLPIVNEEVRGTKVSIYNERVNPKYPLNGFRLKNSAGRHLLQGPLTVFDGGIYAGDARMQDLASGQEGLISYAVDLKTEVEPQSSAAQETLTAAGLRKGTLVVTRKLAGEKAYNIRNRDEKEKTVIIEHPFRADWKLVEPAEAGERTREAYRFPVPVGGDGKARLVVREEKQLQQTIMLADAGPDQIRFYVNARQVSPRVKEALRNVIALRDRLEQTAAQRSRLEKRVEEITQEQVRIRENMGRIPQNAELYSRYLSKLDQQETEIESLRRAIATHRSTEDTQKRELTEYLLGLDLD